MDFNNYWTLIGGEVNFADRKAAAQKAWNLCSASPKRSATLLLENMLDFPGGRGLKPTKRKQ